MEEKPRKGRFAVGDGRPRKKKGDISLCTRAKNEFFEFYFKSGGKKRLKALAVNLLRCTNCGFELPYRKKPGKCEHCGKNGWKFIPKERMFLEDFVTRVLPGLMPKKTDINGNLSGTLLIKIKGKDDDNEPPGSPGPKGS